MKNPRDYKEEFDIAVEIGKSILNEESVDECIDHIVHKEDDSIFGFCGPVIDIGGFFEALFL